MKKGSIVKTALKWINHYFVFFLLAAFVITCCTMLFVSTLRDTLRLTLTSQNIQAAAKLTFWNVVLLSGIFTVIDILRRKLTVERPVKSITDAAERIIQGDFSVRLEQPKQLGADDTFNPIIDCFNKMAQELGSVETLRSDFIATVSHEMKTPLAVMQNYGTLLQSPNLSEEKRLEYAKGVTEGARRMADMMTNILKLNRLENQQIYPQAVPFDLGEQLCQCLLQFENVWESRQIEIETDIAEDIQVNADEELLSHVWNNLFSNAIKFSEEKGVVGIRLKRENGMITVEVSDNGCGISKEKLPYIF